MTPLQVTTRALFHFDSSSGGATLDSSVFQQNVSLAANASISNARSKFGGSSLNVNGIAGIPMSFRRQRMKVFSFDAWFYAEDNTVSRSIFYCDGLVQLYLRGSTQRLALYNGSVVLNGPSAVALNTWHHVAHSFDGSTHRVFLNGVSQGSAVFGTEYGENFIIGSYNESSEVWVGNFDEARLVEDVLFTSDFTPPTAPYDDVPRNLLSAKTASASLRLLGSSGSSASAKLLERPRYMRDRTDSGSGRIVGTVKEKSTPTNIPLVRRVRLFHEVSGRFIRETWSDAAGNYAFEGIDPTQRYTVVSYDHLQNYRAVIADNLIPEPML